ncbi:uncharacterized protein [Porites lutea]|uniref:uncharacterized protein n=1 Tax=Porites lutea TaxID=51062 RepID=UPI003CC573A9
MATANSVTIISDKYLNQMRLECDPLADDAVLAAVRCHGERVLKCHELYSTIKELGETYEDPSCARFLEFYEHEPPWNVDWEKCDSGRRFFVRNSAIAGLVLMYCSLVKSFTAAFGNKVLTAMGRMTAYGDVRRRLFETLHFVKEVVLGAPGDIKAECMRVRLLHAAVRYYVQHHDNRWEVEKYGYPINQEDLAGTLSTFSSVVLRGLELLGVMATDSEKCGYQQLWKFVGYYLGTENDLLCNSYEEEKNLSDLISSRQCNPDKDSLLLTESLLQAFASKYPFHLSYDTTSKLSRHLINDKELANKLHLRTFGLFGQATMTLCYVFLRLFAVIQRILYPVEWVMYAFGKYSLKSLVELSLNGRKPSYLMKAHS